MATTTGDVAFPEKPLGEKDAEKMGLQNFADNIVKINNEKLKRYHDLVGKPIQRVYPNTRKDA